MKKSLSLSLLIAGMAFPQTAMAELLPAPTDLTGKVENNKMNLAWTAPDYNGPEPFVENFDSYAPYLFENVGDWKFIDGDGLKMNHMYQGDASIPVLRYGEPWAWMTYSNEIYTGSMKAEFNARSGKNALATHGAFGGNNDDWAISPRLSGQAQEISFWVRTFNTGTAPYEVWFSIDGTEKNDFMLLEKDLYTINNNWEQVKFNVPAGARYFAIRYVGEWYGLGGRDCYGFAVDDFSYYPDGSVKRDILGYNVYCDDKLVNNKPLTKLELALDVDATVPHEYSVTTVYSDAEEGSIESDPSVVYLYVPDYDVNAAVSGLESPAKYVAGKAVKISVTVSNNGVKDIAKAKVSLMVNDKEAVSQELQNLAVNAEKKVELTFTPDAMMPAESRFYVKVDAEGESFEKDNVTETRDMEIRTVGVVPDITGAVADGNVNISWSAPVLPELVADVEDFEGYRSYITENIGDWIMMDLDGLPHNLCYDAATMDQMHYNGKYAWQVFSNEGLLNNPQLFNAHSGNKALATYAAFGGENDDWAISPRLSGQEQVISFWARTYGFSGEEGIAPYTVYYSLTGTAKKDFKKIKSDKVWTTKWERKAYTVPEGAVYFAIRFTGSYFADNAGFAIDDFSYFSEDNVMPEFVGYNIYKDGVRVNDKPITEAKYAEAVEIDGSHKYQLSVVYHNGESALSNEYSYTDRSDVSEIGADAAAVTVNGSVINVRGAAAVAVYSLDGVRIAAAAGDCEFELAKGVYVVKADNKVVKVIVR